MWDLGDKGNHHLISKVEGSTPDTAAKLPAGNYIMEMVPDWKPYVASYPVLKQITYRVSSATQLNADNLTGDQAISLMTNGRAKFDSAHKGKSCSMWMHTALDGSLSINDMVTKALAKGATHLYVQPFDRSSKNRGYWCEKSEDFSGSAYSGWAVLKIGAGMGTSAPALTTAATPSAAPSGYVAPPFTPVVKPAAPVVKPKPVTPAPKPAAGAWKPTDPKYASFKKRVQSRSYNWFGDSEYRYSVTNYYVNNKFQATYMGEEIKNISGGTRKYTFEFKSPWKVISHNTQKVVATVKNNESLYVSAKRTTYGGFSWSTTYKFTDVAV